MSEAEQPPQTPSTGEPEVSPAAAQAAPAATDGGAASAPAPDASAEASGPSKADAAKAKLAALGNVGKGAIGKLGGPLKALLRLPLDLPRALFEGIFKGELSTKLLVLGFFASIGLMAFTGVQLYRTVMLEREQARAAHDEHEAKTKLQQALHEQEKAQIDPANVLFLDKFSGFLTGDARAQGFELEVYIECNEPDTCSHIKASPAPFKEKVTEALQGQSYDELLTDTGKEKLREKISESVGVALAEWQLGASVKRVYFTHFQMK